VRGEVHTSLRNAAELRLRAAGSEHLFDGVEQPFAVVEHDLVELLPPRFFQLACLQRLQVEADGGDRSLELVGHGVDEGIVLLVAPDLTHQEDRIQHHPRNNDQKKHETQDGENAALPVDHEPADVQRDGDRNQADTEDGEEDDGSAAAADHW
jgi:hypothetical protein